MIALLDDHYGNGDEDHDDVCGDGNDDHEDHIYDDEDNSSQDGRNVFDFFSSLQSNL